MILIVSEFLVLLIVVALGGTFIRFYILKKLIQYSVILVAYSNWIYCFFAFWLIGFGWNYFFHIYRKRSILHKLTKIRFCQKNPEIQKRKE